MHNYALKFLVAAGVAFFGASAPAAFFPKIMKALPEEFHGEYVLVARVKSDKTTEEFKTNAPPFATVLSNRVVLAEGTVRTIEAVVRVKQKGTNVHLVSFQGKSSWIILPGDSPSELLVLQPDENKPKRASTLLMLRRKPGSGDSPNAPPVEPRKESGPREKKS